MTTDRSPICKYRYCHNSLAGRRKGTEFCSSTCRGKHSKQHAKARERDRLRRLLHPATRKSVQRFRAAVASPKERAAALGRALDRWCSA